MAAPVHRGHAAVPGLPRDLRARVAERAGREDTGGALLLLVYLQCDAAASSAYSASSASRSRKLLVVVVPEAIYDPS